MALHFYFSVIFIYGMGAFFRPITVQLGWTRAQYSVAAGLQRIEGSIASPVVGLLVDRIGSRRIVFVGITLATIGMVLLSRMQSLFGFYSAYIVVALGMSGVVGIPFMAAAARWFNRRRGRAMGLMFSGATFSGVLIPVLVLSIESLGWRDTMLISAAGILVVGIPAVLIVRDRPEPYGYLPDGDAPVADDDQATGSAAAPPQQGIRVADALRMRSFWVLTLIFGLTSMGPSAMFLHQIPYFESIGFSATAAGTTVATFTLLSGLGRVGAGFLMDFVERRMVVIGLVSLNVLGFLVLVWVSEYWHTIVYALLFGVAFGGMIPARPILTAAFYGTRAFGTITGLMQSLAVVGGVAAPVLMGWVFDTTGSYRPAILTITGVVSLAIPVTLLLPKSRAGGV
jgi:sugar phosphate permease